jgi:hypothetical protein
MNAEPQSSGLNSRAPRSLSLVKPEPACLPWRPALPGTLEPIALCPEMQGRSSLFLGGPRARAPAESSNCFLCSPLSLPS